MKTILIILTLLIAAQSQAYTPRDFQPDYFCPSAHSAYKDALTQLKELKGTLNSLECQDISAEIDKIDETLLSEREAMVNLVSKNSDGILEGDNAQKLQQYTAKATKTAAGIISLAKGADGWKLFGGSCGLDEETRFNVISKASSIVYDATQLLSKVSGPYGVPIAIGGSLLSGVLDGVNVFMQDQSQIDFENQDKRLFYAESLCLVHQTLIENNRLSEPEAQEELFSTLEKHLDKVIETFDKKCRLDLVDCNTKVTDLENAFFDWKGLSTAEKTPFDREQRPLITELNNYSTQNGDPKKWGDAIVKALFDRAWATTEAQKFLSIINHHTTGIHKGEVRVANNIIDEFFVEVANKELLRWFINTEFKKRIDSFRASVRKIPIRLTSYVDAAQLTSPRNHYDPDALLEWIVDSEESLQIESPTFSSSITRAYNQWKALEDRYKSYREYCDFFEKSQMIDLEIESLCNTEHKAVASVRKLIGVSAFHLAYFVQAPYFRTNSRLATFDFSLEDYVQYAHGFKVRQKGARELGAWRYFDNPEDVEAGFEDYFVVNHYPSGDRSIELEAPQIVAVLEEALSLETASGSNPSPFDPENTRGLDSEQIQLMREYYCDEAGIPWEDKLQCQIIRENQSLQQMLGPDIAPAPSSILVPN